MMKKYYLLNGKLYWANSEMPEYNVEEYETGYDVKYEQWHSSLQPCEISRDEEMKILIHLAQNGYGRKIVFGESLNPINVTELVEEKTRLASMGTGTIKYLVFKQPKSEEASEAVEFYTWTTTLTPNSNRKCFMKINKGYYRIRKPAELYEIFKSK